MRISPLAPPFEPGIQQWIAKTTPPGAPEGLTLFRVLANHPALVERLRVWGAYFLGKDATLELRDREVIIDRVCARCRAEYEWGVHVATFAEAAGLTGEQVRALAGEPGTHGAAHSPLTHRDGLLVALVDTLHDTSDVSDVLWAELAANWSPPQLIELMMLAGWYHAIAWVCNAARLPNESWAATFPR